MGLAAARRRGNVPLPAYAGVYAVFGDAGGERVEFVGLSRKVAVSVAGHVGACPDRCGAVAYHADADADKATLQEWWKAWMTQHVQQHGIVPPGNRPDDPAFTTAGPKKANKAEIVVDDAAGDGVKERLASTVAAHAVVAFIKGTRREPECGFSQQLVSILEQCGADYEVVNCMDDRYPELMDAVKDFSEWPTLPQLYANGEFLGGVEIVAEMHEKGELRRELRGPPSEA